MNRIVSIISLLGWIFVMIFPEKVLPHVREGEIDLLMICLLFGYLVFGISARIDDLEKNMEEKK